MRICYKYLLHFLPNFYSIFPVLTSNKCLSTLTLLLTPCFILQMIATLVGMKQNHISNKEKTKRSTSDYGGIFSSTDPYQLPFLYKRGLPNNTNPRDFIKKSLTDTRQLRFHQCYFNPISCFKK